jgi:kynurenine formamidase
MTSPPTAPEPTPLASIQRPEQVIGALGEAQQGRLYDLASGWWRGMPGGSAHPAFNLITYRSPRGSRNEGDLDFMRPELNSVGFGFISEMLLSSMHSGTHIDALCHITCGDGDTWHGGYSADQHLSDHGPMANDAADLPPLVARGLMLDIPGLLGIAALPREFAIEAEHLERACARQGVEPGRGDVVLVRTGQMGGWPDRSRLDASEGAGVSLDGARWLQARQPAAVGADTAGFEVQPSGVPGDPQAVHGFLIHQHGVPILEWVNCEELARDQVSRFLFVALPLTIRGATGSMVRPIAIT